MFYHHYSILYYFTHTCSPIMSKKGVHCFLYYQYWILYYHFDLLISSFF